MKKFSLCLLIFWSLIFLSACGNKTATNVNIEETFNGSMKDLLEKNNPVKCTFTLTEKNQTMIGMIFVSGDKKLRSDYDLIQDNQTIKSSMIIDGDWLYTWSNMMPQGIKMNIKDLEKLSDKDISVGGENWAAWNKKIDFKCVKWSVDKNIMTPPANMQFLDWTEIVKNFSNSFGQ